MDAEAELDRRKRAFHQRGIYDSLFVPGNCSPPADCQVTLKLAASDAVRIWGRRQTGLQPSGPLAKRIQTRNSFRFRSERALTRYSSSCPTATSSRHFPSICRITNPCRPAILTTLMKTDDTRSSDDSAQLYQYFHSLRIAEAERKVKAVHDSFPRVIGDEGTV